MAAINETNFPTQRPELTNIMDMFDKQLKVLNDVTAHIFSRLSLIISIKEEQVPCEIVDIKPDSYIDEMHQGLNELNRISQKLCIIERTMTKLVGE